MRPTSVFLQSQCLLCVFVVSGVIRQLPHSLPWHVSCPARCVCQIKPWFSPESVYHEARTVDCNDLLLTKLPVPIPLGTHTLRLQSNQLSELDSAVLHGLPHLTDLDLSQNHFSQITSIMWISSLPSLLSLHLEENQISHLPNASFSSLPALQELFVSHNNLHSIAPEAFSGLDLLLRLHINNNRLTTVNPLWFRALPSLEVLMLGGNPVETLPEQGFMALRSLRSLVLGDMGLRDIVEDALEGLDSLESLSFYDNLLTKVPTLALSRVPGLKFLDLNKNCIKLIETGDFRDMVHLKELGLNNMEELVSIERGALENLPELTKLEITNNPLLSYIHPQAFLQLSRLESLMLNSNSLSALHQNIMLSLPSLQEVSLHSNPLHCDCLFHWAAGVQSHPHAVEDTQRENLTSRLVRFIQPQATLCSEPPELRGRRVRELSSKEMSASCLPTIPATSLPSYVGVREGGKLVLPCRALADPQPDIYWVTPSGFRLGPAQSPKPKCLQAPTPTDSESLSHTLVNSISLKQAQHDTPCNNSQHYHLLPVGTLEIEKVTTSEAGLYTCVAENALGADTRSITVGVHEEESKKMMAKAAKLWKYQSLQGNAKLRLVELGEHYAILSWQDMGNLPSTRLSWQAMTSSEHPPSYTTRILAGTQSFNLTHLQGETFYRVCLHLGNHEVSKHVSRQLQCIIIRTKAAPEPQFEDIPLDRYMTTLATILLELGIIMLVVAATIWDGECTDIDEELELYTDVIISEKTEGGNKHKPKLSEKLLPHQDC
ncbi:leucine-rich repeat neuronal protein 2-like [Thalassophryne amazonica]|uniref:leucine-rich repeat neuronal protein 2-like n=1 Tax=Thalassophryne amazonica TaxID=390379 RepID=UPI0014726B64|nr:leucine-rich repeat neuronal protein 2-like [Thalassophryne amazonica]